MIVQFLINGLVSGSLIALTALGFSLIYNTMRIFHIAYAGIYLWAGYVLYFFMEKLHWHLIPAVLMALLAAAVLSIACEIIIYRPLIKRGRSHNSVMISSVGVLMLLISTAELMFGNAAYFLNISTKGINHSITDYLYGFSVINLPLSLIIIVIFFLYLKYSKSGIYIRALRDNETLSRLYGIRANKLKILLYGLSGIFAAIAACMSAMDFGINPQLGIPVFINAFVALVIGGVGRFEGPVIGGLLLGLLQALTEYFFDSQWVMMVTFILLILFLLLRPQGLIAEKIRSH
jgi:branched-chain amino acid transport system permease protein